MGMNDIIKAKIQEFLPSISFFFIPSQHRSANDGKSTFQNPQYADYMSKEHLEKVIFNEALMDNPINIVSARTYCTFLPLSIFLLVLASWLSLYSFFQTPKDCLLRLTFTHIIRFPVLSLFIESSLATRLNFPWEWKQYSLLLITS